MHRGVGSPPGVQQISKADTCSIARPIEIMFQAFRVVRPASHITCSGRTKGGAERHEEFQEGWCLRTRSLLSEEDSEVRMGLETREEAGIVHVCAIGCKGLAYK